MNRNQKIISNILLAIPTLYYLYVAIQLLINNLLLPSLVFLLIIFLLIVSSISLYKHNRPLLFVAVIVSGLGTVDGILSLINILVFNDYSHSLNVILSIFYIYPIVSIVKLLKLKGTTNN
jgi:hypothetical protein